MQLNKLQPNRTMHLRGFDDRGAAAALHSATATSFKVSGVFRDPADFAVLMLWDADDFFGHPRFKWLPDFAFDGMVLQFDANYSGLQPLDTVKFPTIDNTFLDVVRADGTTAKIPLFDHAALAGGSFPAARGTLAITGSGFTLGDRLTLWYLNNSYVFTAEAQTAPIAFTATGVAGTVHSVSWASGGASATYSHAEGVAETNTALALAMLAAVNGAGGPIDASQPAGNPANQIEIGVAPGVSGEFTITSTDSGVAPVIRAAGGIGAASAIAAAVNATDWNAQALTLAIRATAVGPNVTIAAARYGRVNTLGKVVTLVSGLNFTGMAAGDAMDIAGVTRTVDTVQSSSILTLTADPGNLTGAVYLAERGGADGNSITLYTTVSGAIGATPVIPLTGGASDLATWRVTLDFTALGIDQMRQCWLTFAPAVGIGAAYADTEWVATYSNWSVVSDPNGRRPLQVAGPGSVRIDEPDAWVTFRGASWKRLNSNQAIDAADGFFSKGFVMRGSAPGDSVTVKYACQFAHELWMGTSLYVDRGIATVSVDGDAATTLNCFLSSATPVTARRQLRPLVAAGEHTVTIAISGGFVYFDFLEAVVRSDAPAPFPLRAGVSAALDYDTDHSYKLPAARLMWMMDQLGLGGPINEYAGVFWWCQRVRSGATLAALTLTFRGSWAPGDQIFLRIGAPDLSAYTEIGKTFLAGDSNAIIAAHFAYFINATFTGVWAQASGAALTITVRSPTPAYAFGSLVRIVGAGAVDQLGGLTGSVAGIWSVDTAQSPTINRGAREWHADLFAECQARAIEVTTAFSMELLNPPASFAARYPDGTAVTTATGFATNFTTHCAFRSDVLAYQQRVFNDMAALQVAAGLPVALQVGEFTWWYFANSVLDLPGSGMAYYDGETAAAALAALGRPLKRFLSPDSDPAANASADANFLRTRLVNHIAALRAAILLAHPGALLEILLPLDVNYPSVYGAFNLGGRLNFYINIPPAFLDPAAAPFDRVKMEGLDFGSGSRDLGKALRCARFPYTEGSWPKSRCSYLIAIFNGGCPWRREELQTLAEGLPRIAYWAWDHVNLFGWELGAPSLRGDARVE